ncbi:MAG TPA: 50S ribosomal protein L23 [Candidatus Nitrosocosmicus sp.]|nr:50S ribosomal protein L23 [Candidatus Nitrosocosmicus sp.]
MNNLLNSKSLDIDADLASKIILEPYVTEKTFNIIEKENKLSFIVHNKATKQQIIKSMKIIYEAEISEVNTFNTIRGKKAIMKFRNVDGARQLATNLGLV